MESPFSYQSDSTVMIVGIGLMGQYVARTICNWMSIKRLMLIDHSAEILVGTNRVSIEEFAHEIQTATSGRISVQSAVVDVTNEESIAEYFERNRGIDYWLHTAGISPKPLTPPDQLTKSDVLGACEINLWGAMNLVKQGAQSGAFIPNCRGVIVLSTSATVGSEGRASAAYEVSKAGLANFLQLHSRYFAEKFQLVLNGLAPSPLRGLMAAQNPISATRLQAVEDNTPMGALTGPRHIAAACMYLWAKECWCLGEIITVDGGYTKHRPIFGSLN